MAEEGQQKTFNMRKSSKIIIIGAGIAGIAAGNMLAEAGLTDFVILEASNRIGGRIHSIGLGKLADLHSYTGLPAAAQLFANLHVDGLLLFCCLTQ